MFHPEDVRIVVVIQTLLDWMTKINRELKGEENAWTLQLIIGIMFYCRNNMGLESELGEEPFVLASLVALLKLDPGLEPVRLPLDGILQVLRVDLLKRNVHAVTCGHQVVVVHQLKGRRKEWTLIRPDWMGDFPLITHLEEGLDLGALLQLSLAHAVGDFAGVPVDSGHQSVSKLFVRTAVVEGLDDDRLASCVPAAEDQHDFIRLHDLPHLGAGLKVERGDRD